MSETAHHVSEELRELQTLNRDLIALLALPAMWSATAGSGRGAVIEVLLDVLLSMLRLDWVFARVGDPPRDFARANLRVDYEACAVAIGDALASSLTPRVQLPEELENPCGTGRLRLASVPMAAHGAVIVAASSRATFPSERDLLILRVATNQTSIGLEAARLMEAERRRSVQLSRLAEAALQINSLGSLDGVLKEITERAREIIGAHQAVTSLTTGPDFAQVINTVSLSDKCGAWRKYDAKPDGSGIYRLVCDTNRPMRLTQEELERHPAWRGLGQVAKHHPPLAGWLAAPLVARDGANIGLIQLSDKVEGDFDEADERILVQLAQMATVALENVRLTDDLRESRAAALEADRKKDEFLALLGHELRNPLAPIITALELMKLRGDSSGEREREVIERQVRHVARLVDDLLDVSRFTRGKIELRTTRLNLSSVLAKAIDIARPLLELRQHDLQVDLPPEGAMIDGDPVRLAQVFANLLTNAAKYTEPQGRLRVRVRATQTDAIVTVSDNGMGIPPETVPHIFEMFVQAARTIDRAEGGLGLGLTIVRTLVKLHGGTVSAHSSGPGKGSEFTVTLPLASDRPEDAATPAMLRSAAPRMAGRSVLIVDDNTDARELFAETLQLLGHAVQQAGDGPHALALAETNHFDVALLDIGLPVMDGYELARELRRMKGSQLRLFAVTGYGLERDRAIAASVGFDGHFVKPVNVVALEAAIRGDRPE